MKAVPFFLPVISTSLIARFKRSPVNISIQQNGKGSAWIDIKLPIVEIKHYFSITFSSSIKNFLYKLFTS